MSPKVLLVEDDRHNREALTICLRLMGVQVKQARDGFEALQKLAQEAFDVVVSDLRMPGINGLELSKRIHEKLGRFPVVLMTADPNVPPVPERNESYIFEILIKPFRPSELEKIIRRALGDSER
jgi:DNA-binding NtrC family response regulator